MQYPVNTSAIIDITMPPYCADNTGKTDCTAIICKALDDVLIRMVEALKATYDKLIELSNNKKEDAFLGLETGRVENGILTICYPENEPSNKIIYFPKGTYLVSDTITYSLENLKQFWYVVYGYENCRNIHFLGESKNETIIRLADHSKGFEAGNKKALISFYNHEIDLPGTANNEFTNVAFMNTIEDITLDCGNGNEGVIGINYVSSNCGRIDNVDIKTANGACGIVTAGGTQGVFKNINISGFDYGLDIENSLLVSLDKIDFSQNKVACIYAASSTLICSNIFSGSLTTMKFKDETEHHSIGRYYFTDSNITFDDKNSKSFIYVEESTILPRNQDIPINVRSKNPNDWVLVDDFGAKGDGVTDSTRAIQTAMNSGKSIVIFGEGEYLINQKIKIPKTVKTVDFLFCSLACGTRLVGGECDAAFEVSEDSEELLFFENLSAWEDFKGHIRLVKHAAKRDIVLSDIHLMSAALYFNTIEGSNVYMENCFATMGTYSHICYFPGKNFVPIYCGIIPLEVHGQKVYGRIVNLERANLAVLNDNSEIFFDGFRTEGGGSALKEINGGTAEINVFNAALGNKEAENALFEMIASAIQLNGAYFFGFDQDTEYNVLITDNTGVSCERIIWDDALTVGKHTRLLSKYINSIGENK